MSSFLSQSLASCFAYSWGHVLIKIRSFGFLPWAEPVAYSPPPMNVDCILLEAHRETASEPHPEERELPEVCLHLVTWKRSVRSASLGLSQFTLFSGLFIKMLEQDQEKGLYYEPFSRDRNAHLCPCIWPCLASCV